MSITVDFWADIACFTQPALKVDRMTYPVPTPSACRGMLASVYSKPKEFYWLIRRIEILRPIRYLSCKLNEITCVMNPKAKMPIDVADFRTQRNTVFLRDVKYRITADIVPQKGFETKLDKLIEQAERRIRKGQCFKQPFMGLSNCIAYFGPPDMSEQPVALTKDCHIMVYDTHVPCDNRIGVSECSTSLYHCVVQDGIIDVPDYDSPDVFKMQAMMGGGGYVPGIV